MYKLIYKYIKCAIQHYALYHNRYVFIGDFYEVGVTEFGE